MPDTNPEHTRTALSQGDWRGLPIGSVLERRQLTVSPQRLRDYFYGSGWPLSNRAAGERLHGRLVAPPSLLFFEPARFDTFVQAMGERPGLNTENRWEYYAPLRVGEPLTLELQLGQRWIKRAYEYAEFVMDAFAADGQRVARGTFVEAWQLDVPAPQARNDSAAATRRPSAARSPAAAPYAVQTVHFSLAMSMAISGPGDFHTDKNIAQAWGYPAPVLAGPQFVVCVAERMRDILGADFWTRGKLQLKLIRPVFVDSDVEVALFDNSSHRTDATPDFEIQLRAGGVLSSLASAALRTD
ncbi:MAG: hypothetical protein ACRYG5_14135 [Janthinobacterium lividum]